MQSLPDIDDIKFAAKRLHEDAVVTPLLRSDVLDGAAKREIWVKAECLQHTGSFKYRGARNRILALAPTERIAGVVAYSSGNHAQGVALAAMFEAIPCLIVMPADTPAIKIDGVRKRDAEIVFYDRLHENRAEIAAKIAKKRGAVLIPPYEDPHIISGQGTVGLEINSQSKELAVELQAVVTNAGGGGLTAGVALALQAEVPTCKLYTTEPAGFDDHRRSFVSGKRETNSILEGSICDALMAETPGKMTFSINHGRVAAGLVVTDDEVRHAMRAAFVHLKLVIEPGGAASLAAALSGKVPGAGPICVIATGGNVDPDLFASILSGANPD